MERKVCKQCYDLGCDRTEYKVFPYECPINREYCFGGRVWIGEIKPECTIDDVCKFCDVNSFEDFYNRVDCSHGDMGCIMYCPGKIWQCPVTEKCVHSKISKDKDNYISPNYVGDRGCNAFMEIKI